MLKLAQKWNKHVEQIGTCDFSVFAEGITLKSFFGTIKGTEIDHKIHENQNEIIDRKKGTEMVPKCIQNGSARGRKSTQTVPKTMSEARSENGYNGAKKTS